MNRRLHIEPAVHQPDTRLVKVACLNGEIHLTVIQPNGSGTLTSRLSIPLFQIREVTLNLDRVKINGNGRPAPGAYMPGALIRGDDQTDGDRIRAILQSRNAIVFELRDSEVKQVVVEVEDAEATVGHIRRLLRR